ncbi:MAG TPA: prepilin-type N-terminal cleavage/methylation domain-containing protein [Candidatus Eisenbacteria bacterium]|nr:prepilin-type N-terminal cleavage/methylation domain-containing protein [Candidatus Eisenbacteria bacterium]
MKKSSAGVTLIELILIIAIGAVVTGGAVRFAVELTRQGIRARDAAVAYNLARLKMAEADAADFSTLTTGNAVLPDEASFPGYDIRREISDVATAAGPITLRRVDIVVDYAGGTFASPLARLITYRHNLVRFGDGA